MNTFTVHNGEMFFLSNLLELRSSLLKLTVYCNNTVLLNRVTAENKHGDITTSQMGQEIQAMG